MYAIRSYYGNIMDTGLMRLIFAILFTKTRITSYNVCYTKLLRARFADLEGFSDLAYLILGIILLGIFAFVLIFSFIINVIRKRK